jgi:hypothetical protein
VEQQHGKIALYLTTQLTAGKGLKITNFLRQGRIRTFGLAVRQL